MKLNTEQKDPNFGFNFKFKQIPEQARVDGFNEYGVRENNDGSIDVRFKAMEPGTRKGIDIEPEFLDRVTDFSDRVPLQLDHSREQLSNVGYVEPGNVKFSGDYLMAQTHIPNTGSDIRDNVIADFTHDPPQITDISVGFDPKSVEVERESRESNPRFVDANIAEFSLTPFPGGYDNGGITPEFSEAVEEAVYEEEPEADDEAQSYLVRKAHNLIRR